MVNADNVLKKRALSITHYDIYKPGFLVSRQEMKASRMKEMSMYQNNGERSQNI